MSYPARSLALGLLLLAAAAAPAQQLPKLDGWVEVRSPHFVVASDAGEKTARRIAGQFERIREVYRLAFEHARVDAAQPVVILAARNEKTLRQLLPAYWEDRERKRPAGIFLAGPERNYVALRVDTSGDNPYHTVYHEYFHLLVRLNYPPLPAWLDEGMAEFWANTSFVGRDVRMGDPSAGYLYGLQRTRLIPMEEFFRVDQRSPHYNHRDKSSIFYGQSWAVVHYLMVGHSGAPNRKKLFQLLDMLRQGVPPEEAHRRALGDFTELQKDIEGYIRRGDYFALKMPAPPAPDEKSFPARLLSPAEAAVLQGDFHVHTNRPAEARALLQEALRLEPNLAAAHEGLGYLHFRQNRPEEAAAEFSRAAELDSRSYLTHYYRAMLLLRGGLSDQETAEVEKALQRAVELNPSFAPAYSMLAVFLARRDERLEQALEMARKAVALEPGQPGHQFNLAGVLLQAEKFDEARRIAARLAATATDEQAGAMAADLLRRIEDFEESQAMSKRMQEQTALFLARRPPREETSEPSAAEPSTASPPAPGPEAAPAGPWPGKPRVTAEGRIAQLSCDAARLELTLDFGGLTLKLEAGKYAQVEYLTTQWQAPRNFNPCLHLLGRTAAVVYVVTQEEPFVGEIISIEVRK